MSYNIAVLLTSHNRREKTLACLRALFASSRPAGVDLQVYLVDDGSQDGTGEAVLAAFPAVHLLKGDGTLFWGGGMRMAFTAAEQTEPGAFLWLNDDTLLFPDTLGRLIGTWLSRKEQEPACILVGATRDLAEPHTTYGGVRKSSRWGRPRFHLIAEVLEEPALCDAMNGNCVLISAEAAKRVGKLDARFPHGMGDFDYAMRARRAGIPVLLVPGWVGICTKNSMSGSWRDGSLPIRERWRKLTSIKGLPPRAWWAFCWRHMGWYAPISFLSPYLRLVLDTFHSGTGRKASPP
jgi:GT2 family glycosyltransferase